MKKIILAISISLISATSNAELIVGDYESVGDGGVLIDSNTGKEWIKISYTDGLSGNQAIQAYADHGWVVADEISAEELMAEGRLIGREAFKNLFGLTYSNYGLGWYKSSVNIGSYAAAIWGSSYEPNVRYYDNYTHNADIVSHNIGVLMYRNDESMSVVASGAPNLNGTFSVPLPASFGLLSLGILAFRRKNK